MSKSKKKVHAPVADLENDPTEVMNTETYLAQFDAEPTPADLVDDTPQFDADDVGESEEAADEAVEAMPFVKLAKDQLPERGTPEREAYRKARRAAARAARKARVAA